MCPARSSYDGAGPSKIVTAPTCMCDVALSWARKDASIAVSRSPCAWATRPEYRRRPRAYAARVIDLARAQAALREEGLGAWVLYDFRGSNPVLWHVLGTAPPGTTRRLVLVIPARGEPALICSRLDHDLVAGLGVPLAVY